MKAHFARDIVWRLILLARYRIATGALLKHYRPATGADLA
jgi:hypothetical protein